MNHHDGDFCNDTAFRLSPPPLLYSTKASTGQHNTPAVPPATNYFMDAMDDHNEDRMEDSELSDDEFQELSFDDLLDRVESNDPSLASVRISTRIFIPNNDGGSQHRLDRLATAIGRNTQLTALMFDGYSVRLDEAQATSLFHGIACNQSIKRFHFNNCGEHLGNACRILTPLFKRNQVERIRIDNCNLSINSTRLLVTSLAEFDSLKEFALTSNTTLTTNTIQDDPDGQQVVRSLMQALSCHFAATELMQALSGHSGLRKLDLTNTYLGMLGCSALVDLLTNPNINLRVLDLAYNNLGDTEAAVLASGMAGNTALKEIDLAYNSGITQAGWQAIFDALSSPSCRLEKLLLDGNAINDAAAQSLSSALTSITTLNLGDNRLNDEVMDSLIDVLAGNMSLRSLNLSSNHGVTGAAWQSFCSIVLSNPSSELEQLGLEYCDNIDDTAIRSLTNALANNTKLKVLDLSCNHYITNACWAMFTSFLESPNTALEELHLGGNNMNDATCTSLLNSLASNKKLKKLMLDHSADWQPPVSVLCNTNSIMSTYNSNHILENLGGLGLYGLFPEEFESFLQINRENRPSQAARLKIIKTHFNEGFVTPPFVDMDLNVLPHAMAWMSREGRPGEVNDHFYGFIRSMSSLFENVN